MFGHLERYDGDCRSRQIPRGSHAVIDVMIRDDQLGH